MKTFIKFMYVVNLSASCSFLILMFHFRIQALREELLRGNYDIVLLQVSKCFHIFMDTQCFGPGDPQSTCTPRTNLILIKFMIQLEGFI